MPSWAKDPKIGYKMINARAETVSSKPSFRHAVRSQRCLVPSSGFYEWQKGKDGKTPYFIRLKSKELFSFAGLYEVWKGAENYELHTYTITTTEPNDLMAAIHDRMPVILSKKDEGAWVDHATPLNEALGLLKPYPSDRMEAYQVSNEVNSVRNSSETLITPKV